MKFKQTISEYVGAGHPDRVADNIANIIKEYAQTSATEVLVSKAGLFITGETTFKNKAQENKAKKEIRKYLKRIIGDYNLEHKIPKVKFNFVKQDEMLADRKREHKAGDQEVVYVSRFGKDDVHSKLRVIDDRISSEITDTLDYKVLVNLETKKANVSISKSHKDYSKALEKILILINKLFGIKRSRINIVEFEGGTFINDTGVTGRKLIVEQQGCGYPHGGGAVYGKDETKTAPYAHKLGREYLDKHPRAKTVVVTYMPGDDLDKPEYIGKVK